jgi:hypothetical protein
MTNINGADGSRILLLEVAVPSCEREFGCTTELARTTQAITLKTAILQIEARRSAFPC